jgi:hypothetical protein
LKPFHSGQLPRLARHKDVPELRLIRGDILRPGERNRSSHRLGDGRRGVHAQLSAMASSHDMSRPVSEEMDAVMGVRNHLYYLSSKASKKVVTTRPYPAGGLEPFHETPPKVRPKPENQSKRDIVPAQLNAKRPR